MNRFGIRLMCRACLVAVVALVLGGGATDAAFFVGGGTNNTTGDSVSGSALFTVSGDTMTIVLTNTTAGGTLARGDTLMGVAYDIAGDNPTLSLTGIALTDGTDAIFTSKTDANNATSLAGSYVMALGTTPISEFGVSASGFGGAFSASGITGGGGEDYGLVANGTFPAPPGAGTSSSFNSAVFPLIQDSLKFTLTGISGVSESRIEHVRLLFGTSGAGVISTTLVPEPSSIVLVGLGAGVAAIWARRRRSAAA